MSLDLRTEEDPVVLGPLISIDEGVQLLRETYGLRKDRTSLLHWIQTGELTAYLVPRSSGGKGGRRWMFKQEDLIRVAREHAIVTSLRKPDGTRERITLFPSELDSEERGGNHDHP